MGKNEEDWMEVEREGKDGGRVKDYVGGGDISFFLFLFSPSIGQRLEVRASDSFLSPHLDFAADTF